ncbi:MAG TPA: response regulator [Elusimicrobia bacterium]|nr:response regulator [Elusimicrobiota bacterium]
MNHEETGKPIEILLVEDNPADVRLTKEALRDSKVKNKLYVVESGVEAIDFLRHKGKYTKAVHPDLILLDLNLPKKSGREVLKEIKEDEDLKSIPVVILTISQAEEDILGTYHSHANCYIAKPIGFDQFIKVVKSIENFWFTIVKLPPK